MGRERQGLRGSARRLPAGHKGFCGAGGRAGWAVRRLGCPETSALTSRRALGRFGGGRGRDPNLSFSMWEPQADSGLREARTK